MVTDASKATNREVRVKMEVPSTSRDIRDAANKRRKEIRQGGSEDTVK